MHIAATSNLLPEQPSLRQTNIHPSNNQIKSSHIQFKYLQEQLKLHPLRNKQLDKTIRARLETFLLIMVRSYLVKTTPAYQDEAAQMIINNWSVLSSHTQQLIRKFCTRHLESPEICKHYREALQTILNKVHPSDDSTIQIAPTSEHPTVETAPNSPQNTIHTESIATSAPPSLPKAEYQKGHKIRFFQNKEWRALKTEIKQAYVNTSWAQFLSGVAPAYAQETIADNMKTVLNGLKNNPKLKTKAEKYIDKKSKKHLYALNENGQGMFRTKGTTLSSRVFRTGPQRFYTLLNHVSSETKAQIQKEQGVTYNGTTFLGSGASGAVQLAKLYDHQTQHIVAAKTVITEHTSFLKRESKMRAILKENPDTSTWVQTNDYFKKMSVDRRKSCPILFMDLHANGDLWSVTKKLSNISNHTLREKTTRTVAKQLIENVLKLHQANIAHRDIKPDNFMLSKDGKILPIDFGTSSTEATVITGNVGTPEYWAPEEGNANLDPNENTPRDPKLADIYSLGALLFNILQAAKIGKTNKLREISNSLIHPNPNARPRLTTILVELGNDTFTPSELLHVLRTGKQPS